MKFFDLSHYRNLVLSSIDKEIKRLNKVFDCYKKRVGLKIDITHNDDIFYRVLNYDSTEKYLDIDRINKLRKLKVKQVFRLCEISTYISVFNGKRLDITVMSTRIKEGSLSNVLNDFSDAMDLIDESKKNIML